MAKKLIWDNDRLALLLKVTNREFPSNPIRSIKYLKHIIRKMEIERGISVDEHNHQEYEIAVKDLSYAQQ